MIRPIEPSDTERAEWPDTTRAYVEYLEGLDDELNRALGEIESLDAECDRRHSALTMTPDEAAIRADERAKVIGEAVSICNEVQGGAVESGLGQMAMGAVGCRRDIADLHTPASREITQATP